MMKKDEC